MKTIDLFCYGTLKRGGGNHYFLQDQHFLGECRTAPTYLLFNAGGFPALVYDENGYSVSGELYEVDKTIIPTLDILESVGHNLFHRDAVILQSPFADKNAIAYLFSQPVKGLIRAGSFWRENTSHSL
jgi:gamma-glutamylcyclotransferase (GGCT)/AIG2-like uncharacterized protein YtfP